MKNNTVDLAHRVALKSKEHNSRFSIDPLTIIAITNVIITLIKWAYKCFYNRSRLKSTAASPGVLARLFIRRAVRANVLKQDRDLVYVGLLEVLGEMSDEDFDRVLEEIEREI